MQKVNQGLEDKLLKMVDRGETEKNNLQEDVATLTKKLIEQQSVISKLHEENVSSMHLNSYLFTLKQITSTSTHHFFLAFSGPL